MQRSLVLWWTWSESNRRPKSCPSSVDVRNSKIGGSLFEPCHLHHHVREDVDSSYFGRLDLGHRLLAIAFSSPINPLRRSMSLLFVRIVPIEDWPRFRRSQTSQTVPSKLATKLLTAGGFEPPTVRRHWDGTAQLSFETYAARKAGLSPASIGFFLIGLSRCTSVQRPQESYPQTFLKRLVPFVLGTTQDLFRVSAGRFSRPWHLFASSLCIAECL